MHEFQQLEESAMAALAPVRDMGVHLALYFGELDVSDLTRSMATFPAVFVQAAALQSRMENELEHSESGVLILVADSSPRCEEAARGDDRSPGVYAILERVHKLMQESHPGHGWCTWQRRQVRPLRFRPTDGTVIYSAVYLTDRVEHV